MKKVIISLLLLVLGIGAQAQLRTSRTYIKQNKEKSRMEWIIRAGVGIDGMAGLNYYDSDDVKISSMTGLDLDFGFNKFFKNSNLYWGMEVGINNRGFKLKLDDERYDDEKHGLLEYTVKFSPFTIGYRIPINDLIELDPHLGAWGTWSFATKRYGEVEEEDLEIEPAFDAGVQVGIGAWINIVNIDIMYQRGFIPASADGWHWESRKDGTTSNILVRVGVRF